MQGSVQSDAPASETGAGCFQGTTPGGLPGEVQCGLFIAPEFEIWELCADL